MGETRREVRDSGWTLGDAAAGIDATEKGGGQIPIEQLAVPSGTRGLRRRMASRAGRAAIRQAGTDGLLVAGAQLDRPW